MRIFEQQAERGPKDLRDVAGPIEQHLRKGNSLTSAFKKQSVFPPLFNAMAEVGEETGHMAEIFGSLEDYYNLQQQLGRKFRAQIAGPVIQFVIAVLIVAGVIWLLGILGTAGRPAFTVLGLSGTPGALIFIGLTLGTVVGIFVVYKWFSKVLKGKEMADSLLLRLPGASGCVQALALGRFTLALHLTLDSGMSIMKAARLSLQATGNAAFEAKTKQVVKQLRNGESLTQALQSTRMFPNELCEILDVAEMTGQIPESMRKQCLYYHEEAARKLKSTTKMLAGAIWLIYAIYVIVLIFQLASIYFNLLKI